MRLADLLLPTELDGLPVEFNPEHDLVTALVVAAVALPQWALLSLAARLWPGPR